MQQLPKNTFLQGGKYGIEKVLGQGGFGITYLATQELLDLEAKCYISQWRVVYY